MYKIGMCDHVHAQIVDKSIQITIVALQLWQGTTTYACDSGKLLSIQLIPAA